MPVDVGSAVGYLDLDISGFLKGFRTAEEEAERRTKQIEQTTSKKLASIGGGFVSAGKTLTAGLTVPLVGALGVVTKFSSEFESSFAKVKTIADPLKKSFEELEQEILDLSSSTGIAAEEISEAVYQAISAGVDTKNAVSFAGQATKLAVAGFTDSATAVDALTTVLNAYKLEAEDAAHISDVLISTQNKGKTTVNELATVLGRVIPAAKSANVSFEDLSTAFSYVTLNGIPTAEASTYIAGALNELSKSGTTVSDTLKIKTGKSFQELTGEGKSLRDIMQILQDSVDGTDLSFGDLWGSAEAARAAMVILNTETDDYNGTLADFKGTLGDTDSAFDTMADTTEFKFNQALNNGKLILKDIGDILIGMFMPYLEKAIDLLGKFRDKLAGMSDEDKEKFIKIAGAVALIGPSLLAVGKALQFVSGLSGTISTIGSLFGAGAGAAGGGLAAAAGPLLAVLAVVGVLAAAFVNLWNRSEEFQNKITSAFEGIKQSFVDFGNQFTEFVNSFGFDFENIGEVLKAFWNWFSDNLAPAFIFIFETLEVTVGSFLDVLMGLIKFITGVFTLDWETAWDGVKQIFVGVWDFIVGFLSSFGTMLYDRVVNSVASMLGMTKEEVEAQFSAIWESITSFFSNLFSGIGSFFSNVWNSITGFFSNLWNGITTFISNIINNIGQIPEKVGYFLGQIVGNVILFVQSIPQHIGNMVNSVIEWFKKLPENIGKFINDSIKFISEFPGQVWKFLQDVIGKIGSFASTLISEGGKAIKDFIDGFVNGFKDFFSSIVKIGGDIIRGIWEGITGAWDWLMNQIGSFFGGFIDGIKDTLGIHSPSTVARDEIGRWFARGIGTGFVDNMGFVTKQMQKSMNDSVDKLNSEKEEVNIGIGYDLENSSLNFVDNLKNVFETVVVWFESMEQRLANAIQGLSENMAFLVENGKLILSDSDFGYYGSDGFGKQRTRSRSSDFENDDKSEKSGDTFNFYSPKPIDEIEAARQMKIAKRDLSEGF